MRITRTIIFRAHLFLRFAIHCTLFFFVQISSGQFYDDFSDGNFISGPEWTGDTADFSITYSSAVPDGQKPALKLDANESDTSFLVVASPLASHAEWRFWVKLSFNTSSNNYARVYLLSDQADLSGLLNGYFVQLGGANDSIGLFRQSGSAITQLIKGEDAFTGNSTNLMRIKVTRDESGYWQMMSDPEGGYNFAEEGNCTDNGYTASSYFGIFCRYTSSNSTKFYFDDIYGDVLFADTNAPVLMDVEVASPSSLGLYFSEPLEKNSAEDSLNYLVSNGIGYPIKASLDPADQTRVELTFQEGFGENLVYMLEVKDIMDFSGNPMLIQTFDFIYQATPPIGPFDVVIHEVMADVNPQPAGLPGADYIELFNRSGSVLNLHGASIKPRESAGAHYFPEIEMPPGSFMVITSTADTADFSTYGKVVGFSGFAVNNEGLILLRNKAGSIVHSIDYDKSLYGDEEKEDGGWALEMIDPENACSMDKNWTASISPAGGTPGAENSVYGQMVSTPGISLVQLTDPYSLRVLFSHQMDSLSVTSLSAYVAGPDNAHPVSAVTSQTVINEVLLNFEDPFQENGMYTLEVADTLRDGCWGIIPPGVSSPFVHPGIPSPWDIVINEIMADPDPPLGLPGHEYIELFNTTDRFLRMAGWTMIIGGTALVLPETEVAPYEYLLLVDSEEALIFSLFAKTCLLSGMNLPNAGGSLTLIDVTGTVMAACSYKNSWFGDPAQADGGYSLEQVDPFNPCGGRENWEGTSATEGGTPGALNSVDALNEQSPVIHKAIVLSDTLLEVFMTSKMDRMSFADQDLFYIDNGMGKPKAVTAIDSLFDHFLLCFDESFKAGVVYHLSFDKPLLNCIGTEYSVADEFPFGLAEMPVRDDIIINEVLFNPAGDGVDFVEVYNRSQKIVNLNALKLGDVQTDAFGTTDTVLKNILEEDVLILPGEFQVFTTQPYRVMEQYTCGSPDRFLQMASFPTYSNDKGTVILSSPVRSVIDCMEYDESMHHPLLNNHEGVSLERIHPDRPSGDATNWHSASSGSGFATPALQNSQFAEPGRNDFEVVVEPAVFSPDNDGHDDVTTISYHFESPGFMASILIFDAEGRPVRTLVNNELLGTKGSFSWDGLTDGRNKANTGIYLLYFEVFDQSGEVRKNLTTVVVGGKLN